MAFDFTFFTTRQPNVIAASSSSVGCRAAHNFHGKIRRLAGVLVLNEQAAAHGTDILRRRVAERWSQRADQPEVFLLLKQGARASASNSGAMITSLKISLIAFARDSSIGRLQMMTPPNGACLSVANAFSHASRRSRIAADAAGVGMLQDRNGRLGKFGDQIRRRADVQNVVKREFLAVQFLEVPVEIAVERRGLMRVLPVTQPRDERE